MKEVGSNCKEGNFWSVKEVGRYCRGVANHDESESEGDLQTPARKGGEDRGGMKRKKKHVVRSDESSYDSE